jgi:hypothetical protein
MNKKHKTKDGEVMFISQMDDNHLKNYINLALKGLETLKNQIRKSEEPKDAFNRALYSDDEGYSEEDLSDLINEVCDNLYPYLAELALRGIDMSERLKEVFERNGANDKKLEESNSDFKLLLENLQ